MLVQPSQAVLQGRRFRVRKGKVQVWPQAKAGVDARLGRQHFGQRLMHGEGPQREGRGRARNSSPGQRIQATEGEAGSVGGDVVALDDDRAEVGFGKVVGGRGAGDAAADDHDVGGRSRHRLWPLRGQRAHWLRWFRHGASLGAGGLKRRSG